MIAFFYNESDNKLEMRLSVHPIEVNFLWNEIGIINDYYSIYANASEAISKRRKSSCTGGISDEFKVLESSGTHVKIESLHLWPVGIRITLVNAQTSGSSFYAPKERNYTPLISDSLCASLRSIDAKRIPWHLNLFILKKSSKRTFYKEDLSLILLSHLKNDYSLGRILRAAMHVGPIKSFLELGKEFMSVLGNANKRSFLENLRSLGATLLTVVGDSANSLTSLVRTIDEGLSTGAFNSYLAPEAPPSGFFDGIKKFFNATTNGIWSAFGAVTMEPIQAYKEGGTKDALYRFIRGVPCIVIRPIEGSVYGMSLLVYGAKKSIGPSKPK